MEYSSPADQKNKVQISKHKFQMDANEPIRKRIVINLDSPPGTVPRSGPQSYGTPRQSRRWPKVIAIILMLPIPSAISAQASRQTSRLAAINAGIRYRMALVRNTGIRVLVALQRVENTVRQPLDINARQRTRKRHAYYSDPTYASDNYCVC